METAVDRCGRCALLYNTQIRLINIISIRAGEMVQQSGLMFYMIVES